ncbi:hypothetical protein NHQ30_005832 [Ciborinia camelliae]|nr:hypothetical protein NHQ30_005832 [Ciborinia camelliae]
MNRSRYEPLPTSSPSNPPILLDPILSNHPSYNYNSGTPTSAPPSHRPSITSTSSRTPPPSFHSSQLAHSNNPASNFPIASIGINPANYSNDGTGTTPFPPFTNTPYPDSAPPSFHSRSSTPRPTPSTRTLASNGNISHVSAGSGVDLWGVATTSSGDTEIDGDGVEDREGNIGVTAVKGLERRMERLEESIGRLLVSSSSCFLISF